MKVRFEIHVSGTYQADGHQGDLVSIVVVAVDKVTGNTIRELEEWRDVPYGDHTASFAYRQAQEAVAGFRADKRPLREFKKLCHGRGGFHRFWN